MNTCQKQRHYLNVLFHSRPIIETEIPETFSPQSDLNAFTVCRIKVMTHFAKKCNHFNFYMTFKRPELLQAMDSFCLFL